MPVCQKYNYARKCCTNHLSYGKISAVRIFYHTKGCGDMNMEQVSVIIPVYNAEKFLRRCLDSLRNQTYRNIEVLMVDDGSTDRSLKICKGFAAKDGRFKVLQKQNGGASSARNLGLTNSGGGVRIICRRGRLAASRCGRDALEKEAGNGRRLRGREYYADFPSQICRASFV